MSRAVWGLPPRTPGLFVLWGTPFPFVRCPGAQLRARVHVTRAMWLLSSGPVVSDLVVIVPVQCLAPVGGRALL